MQQALAHMDEDVLSDVVPSNIVSRQVNTPFQCLRYMGYSHTPVIVVWQESEGADDGESEYIDGGASMEEDELQSDNENEVGSLPYRVYRDTKQHLGPLHQYVLPIKIGEDTTNGTTTREKTKTKSRREPAACKEAGDG